MPETTTTFFYIMFGASAIVSYLLGGINAAIIMSRLVHHEDIRKKGSGNPGFTNYKRVYGGDFVAWLVLILDVLKTVVPVLASALVMQHFFGLWQFAAAFSGLFCMLGHCFPVWYKFKGGKAFIAGFATTWFVDWRMALIAMTLFMIILFTVKYMSVASCTASFACPVILSFLSPQSIWVLILCAVSALLVIVRHYENFIKLAKGTESKFSLKSKAQG